MELRGPEYHQADSYWYLAICNECKAGIPFYDQRKRNEWATKHAETGHTVALKREERTPLT